MSDEPPPAAIAAGRIAEAGVDWVSATAPYGKRYDDLKAVGEVVLNAQRLCGNDLLPWHWNGYDGARCGHASWGTRHDGGYLRVSSDAAHVWWADIWKATNHYARLDLQVTVENLPAGFDLALYTRNAAKVAPLRRGRPIEWQYLETREKGCTTYVGSRSSAVFGRVYDKSAERGGDHLGGTWRYELECKDDAADGYARRLASAANPSATLTGLVHKWFHIRSVAPAFTPTVDAELPMFDPNTTDDAKRLAWLRDHVSITVAKLLAKGYRNEVLQALNLAHPPSDPASSSAATATTGLIN